jgi:hypothetical protein
MKIKLLTIFSLGLLLISCKKPGVANDQAYSFIKFFGGDKINEGYDVKQLSDGGFIILGSYSSSSSANDSGLNMYLIRTDVYGNELWHRTYGGIYDDIGYSIQVLSTGGYILAGTTVKKNDPINPLTNILLIKVKENGDTLWTRTIGGNTITLGYNVQETSNGGFVIAGSQTISSGITEAYLVLTDSNGVPIKDNLFNQWIEAKFVIELNDGFLFTGSSQKSILQHGDVTGLSDIFINTVDKHLNITDNINIGGFGSDVGEFIKKLSDNTFLCLGTDSGNWVSLTKFYSVNDKMHINWTKLYSPANLPCQGKCIDVISDNEYVITGISGVNPNQDVLFLKTDSAGKDITDKTNYSFGGTGNQRGESIIKTKNGGFVIVGTNEFSVNNSVIGLFNLKPNGGF